MYLPKSIKCLESAKDDPVKIKSTVDLWKAKNYPSNIGLSATSVMLGANNEKLNDRYTDQKILYLFPKDQISFDPVSYFLDASIKRLSYEFWCKIFSRRRHLLYHSFA